MASKGLRVIYVKIHEKLKRTTTLRIPQKPLLAILRVSASLLFNNQSNILPEINFFEIIFLLFVIIYYRKILY